MAVLRAALQVGIDDVKAGMRSMLVRLYLVFYIPMIPMEASLFAIGGPQSSRDINHEYFPNAQ